MYPPRTLFRALTASLLTASVALAVPSPGAGQARTSEYEGAIATGLALRTLGNTARVLHIGAHPDDENTSLFAPLALGRGADVAYLSLTRGEGGQNGIGPELGTALGIIRSEELLSARRLDGGVQFFTRALDYGFSKNAEEAFRHWPRDTLLADVVEVIRRYRPDIVISVWSGTPADGHGQHQASGIMAREAVLAAGDPSRFPEQLARGLRPHATSKFFWSARYGGDGPDVVLSTGDLDPLLGRSYHQIAMASRSRHRSQDMGRPQDPGPRSTTFQQVDPADPPPVTGRPRFGGSADDAAAGAGSLFAGVDTLLSQRAATLAAGTSGTVQSTLQRVVPVLRSYEQEVARARSDFDALSPWRLTSELARAYGTLTGATESLGGLDDADAAVADLLFHLRDEQADLRLGVLRSANVRVDAVASEERVVPGQDLDLELSVWNGGRAPVRATLRPRLPEGWVARAADGTTESGTVSVVPGQRAVVAFRVAVPEDAALTTPYYLDPSAVDPPLDLYDWPSDSPLRAQPFGPAPVAGSFQLDLEGASVATEVEAEWIGLDLRSGEFRRPVKVVPAFSVALSPVTGVLPLASDTRSLPFTIRLRSELSEPASGAVRLRLPPGWTASPESLPVSLAPVEERTVEVSVTRPDPLGPGEYPITAELLVPRGEPGAGRYSLGYTIVDYPHIAPHHLYRPAAARVRAMEVEVAAVRVGYVAGAGDGVPEALDQLGVDWEALDAQALGTSDLDRFDVIITGIRAYEVRADLAAHNARLLDWARRGGTLIVQYNKYEFPAGDFAPWPVAISRPHGRVTDPAAPVTVLEPGHPVLNTPNAIRADDWAGWVQERGLYFLESWDGPLTPLLAMSDPGEAPLTGALLVGPLGEGTYVYTGLSFFRQLPAGVPGAYRLLANLVSLGARP